MMPRSCGVQREIERSGQSRLCYATSSMSTNHNCDEDLCWMRRGREDGRLRRIKVGYGLELYSA